MAGRDHRIQLPIEQAGIEMKLLCVAMGKRGVRIYDPHQLYLALVRELLQEPGHMPMLEAHDADS